MKIKYIRKYFVPRDIYIEDIRKKLEEFGANVHSYYCSYFIVKYKTRVFCIYYSAGGFFGMYKTNCVFWCYPKDETFIKSLIKKLGLKIVKTEKYPFDPPADIDLSKIR